jgi:hypothetical protein
MSEERGEFNVVQFFTDEQLGCEYVRRGVSAEEAVKAAHHYSHNVAAELLGLVNRVIITDGGDDCVFEWKKGEGVTFPPECVGRS